jgi:hypothetical protein
MKNLQGFFRAFQRACQGVPELVVKSYQISLTFGLPEFLGLLANRQGTQTGKSR